MISVDQARLTDLVRQAGAGDESALRDLRQQTRHLLTFAIRRIVQDPRDEEEVLQDVYLYVWRNGAEFRNERGNATAWLCMLARSRAIDRFRRTRWDRCTSGLDEHVRPAIPIELAPAQADVWQYTLVRTALRELPACERQLIEMAYFEGFSHSEIAARTARPLGTVKTKIRLALLRLQERLRNPQKLPRAA